MFLCFGMVYTLSWTLQCFLDEITHSLEISENCSNTAKGQVRATEMCINTKYQEIQETHSNGNSISPSVKMTAVLIPKHKLREEGKARKSVIIILSAALMSCSGCEHCIPLQTLDGVANQSTVSISFVLCYLSGV